MKKKIFLLIFILCSFCFILSGCRNADIEKKSYEQLAIPCNDKYCFVYDHGICKNGSAFFFNDIVNNCLINNGVKKRNIDLKKYYKNNHFVIGSTCFIERRYNETDSVVGYVNLNEDISMKILKKIKYNEKVQQFGDDYILINFDDKITIYNEQLESQEIIKDDFDWTINSNYIVHFYDKHSYNIYNETLTKYNIICEEGYQFYDLIEDYAIFDNGTDYIAYQIPNLNKITDQEKIQEYLSDNNLIESKYYCDNDGFYSINNNVKELLVSIEKIREIEEVKTVEEILETTVNLICCLIQNDEIYVFIGNDTSYFGTYSYISTLPMVFKYNLEENNFEYLGTVGNIYDSHSTKVVIIDN